ncbi:MAG TPA: hypothetical protein VN516_03170 [Candidatus Baltobacteraceae bacterium]|nr:hypothetical protein [Candidatus Baltobacteraceae bacterium]
MHAKIVPGKNLIVGGVRCERNAKQTRPSQERKQFHKWAYGLFSGKLASKLAGNTQAVNQGAPYLQLREMLGCPKNNPPRRGRMSSLPKHPDYRTTPVINATFLSKFIFIVKD